MKKVKKVFVTLISVKPLPGCQLDPDEINGAYVRCYLSAFSEGDARNKLRDALINNNFELMEEDFFVQYDLVEWERPNNTDGLKYLNEAKNSDEVIFTEFMTWGHDAPDAW
jgi:hypothetical protein